MPIHAYISLPGDSRRQQVAHIPHGTLSLFYNLTIIKHIQTHFSIDFYSNFALLLMQSAKQRTSVKLIIIYDED